MNNISNTIINNQNEFITKYENNDFLEEDSTDCDKWKVQDYLLQSQIRLIDSLIGEMKARQYNQDISNDPEAECLRLYQRQKGWDIALQDQISSLEEVKKLIENL